MSQRRALVDDDQDLLLLGHLEQNSDKGLHIRKVRAHPEERFKDIGESSEL